MNTNGAGDKLIDETRETALNIMRAMRFASYGMMDKISPEVETFMFANRSLLRAAPAGELFEELKELVTGPEAGIVIRRYVDILGVLIPELLEMKGFDQHTPHHRYDVLEHCIRAMESVTSAGYVTDYQMKLAALLHDVGKPQTFVLDERGIGNTFGHPEVGAEMAAKILKRIEADEVTVDRVCTLIANHHLMFQKDKVLLSRWMDKYTPEMLLEILHIKRADNIATGNMSAELSAKFDEIEKMISEIMEGR